MMQGKTYWLIGASEGIGEALAHELDAQGCKLVLSARSLDRLNILSARLDQKPMVLPFDVSDATAISQACHAMERIDGIIYMAGAYWPMAVQEWNGQQVATMTDVNYLGALRVLDHCLPQFVEQDRGHIVLIGSLAGMSGLPGAIGYGASKAALMHLGRDMQKDLRGTGVRVQTINPGFVKTRLTDQNDFTMPFIQTPQQAARAIIRAMAGPRANVSFPWHFALWFKIRRALGY